MYRPRKGPLYLKAVHPPSLTNRAPAPTVSSDTDAVTTPPRADGGVTILNWCFSSKHYYRLLAEAESPSRGRSGSARKRRKLLPTRVRIRWVRTPRRHHPRPSPPTQVQDLGRVRANVSRLLIERWHYSVAPKGAGPSSPECFSNQHTPPELANQPP